MRADKEKPRDRILRLFLRSSGPLSAPQVATRIGAHSQYVSAILNRLCEEGVLTKLDERGEGRAVLYTRNG